MTQDTLRAQLEIYQHWWLWAALAAGCAALAWLLLWQVRRDWRAPRLAWVGAGFALLALGCAYGAIEVAAAGFWTPTDDPDRFHQLRAVEAYAALDAGLAASSAPPVSLQSFPQYVDKVDALNPWTNWGLWRDAWNRRLTFVPGGDGSPASLVTPGPDGIPGNGDDRTLPRPSGSAP